MPYNHENTKPFPLAGTIESLFQIVRSIHADLPKVKEILGEICFLLVLKRYKYRCGKLYGLTTIDFKRSFVLPVAIQNFGKQLVWICDSKVAHPYQLGGIAISEKNLAEK